jgi:hypothetical protein
MIKIAEDTEEIDYPPQPEIMDYVFGKIMQLAMGSGPDRKLHIMFRGKFIEVDPKTRLQYADRPCEWTLAYTRLGGGAYVSTVYLDRLIKIAGIDMFEYPYETMAFGLKDGDDEKTYQWKYETYEEALEGHTVAVWQVQNMQRAMKLPGIERRIKKWRTRIRQWVRKAKQRGPRWTWEHAGEALVMLKTYSIYPALQDQTRWLMVLLVVAKEQLCCFCGQAIEPDAADPLDLSFNGHTGQSWHRCCKCRATQGSVMHQRKLCLCFTGQMSHNEDNMTMLQSAIAAHEEFKLRHGRSMPLDW